MSRKNSFIAAGTYGCVYRPSLPCDGKQESNSNNQNKVSKVFAKGQDMNDNRSDFEDEIGRNQKANNINAEGAFTLTHVNACQIPSNTLTNAEKESCANSDKISYNNTKRNLTNTRVPQIVYKDGGLPVIELSNNNIPLSQFLINFQNVMQGLVKLNHHRHAHTDIKPRNMLYNPAEQRSTLIDFGFLDHESWLYQDAFRNPGVLMHPYSYYPPEFKVMFLFTVPELLKSSFALYIDKMYKSSLDNISSEAIDLFFLTTPTLMHTFTRYSKTSNARNAMMERFIQSISPSSLRQKYQRVLERFHFTTRVQHIDLFREKLKSQLQFQDFSFSANKLKQIQNLFVNQRFGAKIDLYSVGVSLLEVLSSYLIPLMSGQSSRSSTGRAFDTPMYENIVALLYILSGMVHPDPFTRLSAKEASDLYDIFVDALQSSDASRRTDKLQLIQNRVEERIPLSAEHHQTNAQNTRRNKNSTSRSPKSFSFRPNPPAKSSSPMSVSPLPPAKSPSPMSTSPIPHKSSSPMSTSPIPHKSPSPMSVSPLPPQSGKAKKQNKPKAKKLYK